MSARQKVLALRRLRTDDGVTFPERMVVMAVALLVGLGVVPLLPEDTAGTLGCLFERIEGIFSAAGGLGLTQDPGCSGSPAPGAFGPPLTPPSEAGDSPDESPCGPGGPGLGAAQGEALASRARSVGYEEAAAVQLAANPCGVLGSIVQEPALLLVAGDWTATADGHTCGQFGVVLDDGSAVNYSNRNNPTATRPPNPSVNVDITGFTWLMSVTKGGLGESGVSNAYWHAPRPVGSTTSRSSSASSEVGPPAPSRCGPSSIPARSA